jgi:hypothetical protein
MPIRRIARVGRVYPRRRTRNQQTLLNFASQELGQSFCSIDAVREYYGTDDNEETYEILRQQYNEYVPQENSRLRQLEDANRAVHNRFQHLLELRDVDEITLNMSDYRPQFTLEEILNRIVLAFINVEDQGNFYTIQVGENHYTLNDTVRNRLITMVKRDLIIEEQMGSDGILLQEIKDAETITIRRFVKTNINETPDGAFFKHKNLTEMDFSKYGVFNKHGEWSKKKFKSYYQDNCLIYALKEYSKENESLTNEAVEEVKHYVKNLKVPMNVLPKIADVLKHRIKVNNINHDHITSYGKEFKNEISLGLIDEHYFLNDTTNYTAFAIENYHTIKHLENFNHINKIQVKNGKKYYNREKNRCISSFQAIKLLMKHKNTHLLKLTTQEKDLAHTQFYNSVDESFESLDYSISKNVRKVECRNGKRKEIFHNIFFDFETNTNRTKKVMDQKKFKNTEEFNKYKLKNVIDNYEIVDGKYDIVRIIPDTHKPYVCCCYFEMNGTIYKAKFFGYDCGKQLLDFVPNNSMLIAHNATYDYRFIIKYFDRINSEIDKTGRLICSDAYYGKKHIKVKDSYSLITMKLKDFNKNLKLGDNMRKEVISHKLYTDENIEKQFIEIDYAVGLLKSEKKSEEDIEQFYQNLNDWELIREDNTFDCLEFSANYCLKDCEILSKGYNVFRGMVMDSVSLNIDNILTIPSLSHQYFIKNDCYDGVNEFSGTPQRLMQKTVVGGRCMTNSNMMILCYDILNDFDAVSLYPSAMNMMGFLKGIPKELKENQLNYEFLQEQDGYFLEIVIDKVGKKRQFPLLSFVDENGVRNWTNDMVGKTMYVNKYALEDAIEFQSVEFTVVRGYYFNEGRNYTIKEVIQNLFNERKKWKAENNPVELIYKLIMNSGYGKSITKEINTVNKFFNTFIKFQKYMSKNYNYVNEFNEYGNGKYKVKKIKAFNQHFNLAHVGSEILSMSKRIMNRVMCLAEDMGLDMYYTDTDSIHIKDAHVPILAKAYKSRYNKTLIGKELGQFHTDFDLKVNGMNCKNIVSFQSIFLGKKAYFDWLRGENPYTDENSITRRNSNEYVYGFHIRMKGVCEGAIYYYANENDMKNDIWNVYKTLFDGKTIRFDLVKGGSLNFKYNKTYDVITDPIFTREVKFDGKKIMIDAGGNESRIVKRQSDGKRFKIVKK